MFPQASVEQARAIAAQYRQRWEKAGDLAYHLHKMSFMHIGYGYEDALKTGKCGLYLHEMKNSADCLSLVGALYLVAKELHLDPEIYWGSNVIDAREGEPRPENGGEHAFMTVNVWGKRTLVDPYMGVAGSFRHAPEKHKMVIRQDPRTYCIRTYTTLSKLTEEQYVALVEEGRCAAGGRKALQASQRIHESGLRIAVELQEDELISSLSYTETYIWQDPCSRLRMYALRTPVHEDGSFDWREGKFMYALLKNRAWRFSDIEDVHHELFVPAPLAFQYVDNLVKSTTKTRLNRLLPFKRMEVFDAAGFSRLGALSNHELSTQHAKLQQELLMHFTPEKWDERSVAVMDRRAAYLAASLHATSPKNPRGFVYSATERQQVIDDNIAMQAERLGQLFQEKLGALRTLFDRRKAISVERKSEARVNRYVADSAGMEFMMKAGQESPDSLQCLVDKELFHKEHPVGSVLATSDERIQYFFALMHETFVDNVYCLPALTLPKYRRGLQRILAQ